jgi:hypothetical protein
MFAIAGTISESEKIEQAPSSLVDTAGTLEETS